MKVAILGQGGREHAFACSLLKSPLLSEILVIPGNPGMELEPRLRCISLDLKNSTELCTELKALDVSLVLIGPENLLAEGLSDDLEEAGFTVVGPNKDLAQLESSKMFAKAFMIKHEIPTAAYYLASSQIEAIELLKHFPKSVVLKADELHAGKGVFVIDQLDQEASQLETVSLIQKLFTDFSFSIKTKHLVMEEKLFGKEVSLFALSDGDSYKILGYVCDHKRLLDGDLGPNTGGMGCYTVSSWPTSETRAFIESKIVKKTFDALKNEGKCFKGFLFFGLMVNEDDQQMPAKVIEYNVRMGDPETQTLFPQINEDLLPYFLSLKDQTLRSLPPLSTKKGEAIHIVMAAKGYPGIYGEEIEKGIPITYGALSSRVKIYFAGVKRKNDSIISSGGRVLGLTASGETLQDARSLAYEQLNHIQFKGAQYRHDIGSK